MQLDFDDLDLSELDEISQDSDLDLDIVFTLLISEGGELLEVAPPLKHTNNLEDLIEYLSNEKQVKEDVEELLVDNSDLKFVDLVVRREVVDKNSSETTELEEFVVKTLKIS